MLNNDKNALELKIAELTDRYEEFAADDKKTLLRWLIVPGDLELYDLFFRLQEEETSEIPDLFITFDAPFVDAGSYPRELLASLAEQYASIRSDIAEEEMEADWIFPSARAGESSSATFVRALASLQSYYKDYLRNVVAVLRPRSMGELVVWQDFMTELMATSPPPTIRFLVLEYQQHPLLDELAAERADAVHSDEYNFNMPELLKELAKGTEPGPGADFRVLFVTLGQEASEGKIEAAEETARKALNIATAEGWLQMQIVIQMTLGAAYLQTKDNNKALKTYRKGLKLAETAKKEGDPAGAKLVIQCRFAEAAALIAGGDYQQAARVYSVIPPLADAEGDPLLEMEGWRMTAFCHEKLENFDQAVRYGERAIQAGERLKEDDRPTSTLPYVGAGILRVMEEEKKKERRRLFGFKSKGQRAYDSEQKVRQKMEQLLGPEWEDSVAKIEDDPGDVPS